jgi:hypothetical protein
MRRRIRQSLARVPPRGRILLAWPAADLVPRRAAHGQASPSFCLVRPINLAASWSPGQMPSLLADSPRLFRVPPVTFYRQSTGRSVYFNDERDLRRPLRTEMFISSRARLVCSEKSRLYTYLFPNIRFDWYGAAARIRPVYGTCTCTSRSSGPSTYMHVRLYPLSLQHGSGYGALQSAPIDK